MAATDPGLMLRLSDTALADLAHVASSPHAFLDVLSRSSEVPAGSSFRAASRHVAEKTGRPVEEVERLLGIAANLHRMRARLGLDSKAFMRLVTTWLGARAPEKWKKEHLDVWHNASDTILEAVTLIDDAHPVAVIAKAEQLAESHQNVFIDARLITDIRPVFNSAGDAILESVLCHSLLIEYHDGTHHRHVSFALDGTDVARLRRLCERADAKTAAIKNRMEQVHWPITALDEEKPDVS